jgi:beta propeller repeat protein
MIACLLAAAYLLSQANAAGPTGIPAASAPFLLAGGPGSQKSPALAGNYLAFVDCRTGDCDVWALDLTTKKTQAIAQGDWDEDEPATDGQRVVWRDRRNSSADDPSSLLGNFDIYGADLPIADRKPYPITKAGKAQNRPAVWGDIVVWADFRDARTQFDGEAGNIYLYNLPAGKETAITNARSAQTRPAINGNVVVWADYRNEPELNGTNSDIYAYDLATHQEFSIANAPGTQNDPDMSGNMVVWADWRADDGMSDIYAYDMATRKEMRVTDAPGSQVQPAIWGNIVVWTDFRNEPDKERGTNSDIYGYDFATGQEFPVYVGPGRQDAPAVANGLVAWEDNTKGNRELDVWGANLTGTNLMPPPPPSPYLPGLGSRAFPETGRTVTGIFLDYWQRNGGLAQFGLPLSTVMTETSDLDGKVYTLQYFERAVMEYHPQNPASSRVLLSQLGTFRYGQKYPQGATWPGAPTGPDARLFPQTGKSIAGRFRQYWETHGGLALQGYPISEPFTETSDLDGKPYIVQYFERAVFEMHPENPSPYDVLLSQLGTFRYADKYGR